METDSHQDHIMMFAQALLLLFVANGAPILARLLLAGRLSTPIDLGWLLPDGQPFLGRSKSWRGVISALLLTPLAAVALGLPLMVGVQFAMFAMLGDLISSFIKRRCGIEPSGRALGLDQIPESLWPLIMLQSALGLSWLAILALVILFIILGALFSRLLYRWNIRKRPY